MKKIIFLLLYLILAVPTQAKNIFGLHLSQTSDLEKAAPIVNSNNGDWGYVTIVIRTDQLNHQMWQDFFDQCRKLHLTPIVRLATIMEKDYWKRPDISDIDNLANFLNSLNWPQSKQIIVLFNEPNHATEWGGEVDINNFVDITYYASQKLKSLNPNFYILTTGLDLAAPSKNPNFESTANFYQQIVNLKPDYFNNIDGLASHSYPNHGFIGLPSDLGQHSIRGYIWEIEYLRKLGINKTLPVFITETGWPHREGESTKNKFYTTKTTAKFLLTALDFWQKDNRIEAVTPFIFNFPFEPFDHFSWLKIDETLYPEYQSLLSFPKAKNIVNQITSFKVNKINIPFLIITQNQYTSTIEIQNTGQSIWGETPFCLEASPSANITLSSPCVNPDQKILPNQKVELTFSFTLNESSASSYISWVNTNNYELTPLSKNSRLYRPQTGLWEKIKNIFKR
jgi:hypothetical protein